MFRTTALTTAALLGLATLAPTTAHAAGETCRGVPATLVGTPGSELVGTEGPDVVVTNGAAPVRTLGGDDLVCVTGDANDRVDAGDGNDVVDRSQDRGEFTTTILGAGSDQFVGSSANDVVWAGTKPRRDLVDRDRDVIDGGPVDREYGDYVISGEPGQPNSDEIRLGGGTSGRGGTAGTVELYGTPTAQTVLDGTRGSRLTLETTGASRIAIDTTAGTYTRDDGPAAALTGFADFELSDEEETRYIDFRGSDADETITLDTTRNAAYDLRMGGGDDEIALQTDRIHRRVNVFDGGAGHDQLGIVIPGKEVRLDLRRERLLAGKTRNAVPASATGFEDAEIVAGLIDLSGTSGDNDLRAHGCDVRVRALGGDDKVSPLTLLYDQLLRCKAPRARFEGGGGDDHLFGDGGPDVLVGGPGKDRVNGGSGRDTCQGETMRRCEKRL
jgi:Ca2+-binding RTX toxin-like protein